MRNEKLMPLLPTRNSKPIKLIHSSRFIFFYLVVWPISAWHHPPLFGYLAEIQPSGLCGLLWASVACCGPSVACCGPLWPAVGLCGLLWASVACCGQGVRAPGARRWEPGGGSREVHGKSGASAAHTHTHAVLLSRAAGGPFQNRAHESCLGVAFFATNGM